MDYGATTSLAELHAQYGVNETNLKVEATFEHQGNTFYDVNQTARNPELATDGRLPMYSDAKASVGAPNQTYADAHAEIGAMAQSRASGAALNFTSVVTGKKFIRSYAQLTRLADWGDVPRDSPQAVAAAKQSNAFSFSKSYAFLMESDEDVREAERRAREDDE